MQNNVLLKFKIFTLFLKELAIFLLLLINSFFFLIEII